jgi:hypothetical protein
MIVIESQKNEITYYSRTPIFFNNIQIIPKIV